MHVTLMPWIPAAGEMKTKPTQHSVKELRSIGIQPDILVCRSDRPIPQGIKDKVAEFCNVVTECVITCVDVKTIYEVPLVLEREGLAEQVLSLLKLEQRNPDLRSWQTLVERLYRSEHCINVAIVGKYVRLNDAYLSVVEALKHGAAAINCSVKIHWINAEDIETFGAEKFLKDISAIAIILKRFERYGYVKMRPIFANTYPFFLNISPPCGSRKNHLIGGNFFSQFCREGDRAIN